MSKFDQNLFGRIAVLSGCLTRQQLDACLEEQRRSAGREHIGHILLDKGYLTPEQYDRILDVRRKKVRKLLSDQAEERQTDLELAELLYRDGVLGLDEIEDSVLEQQRLRGVNLRFTLAEVLLSRGALDRDRLLELLGRLGRVVLACTACDSHFRAASFDKDRTDACPKCGHDELRPTGHLEAVVVDGVLDGNELEEGNVVDVTAASA